MRKLLLLLQTILKDKLLYKSIEFKDGFKYCMGLIELHGFTPEYINELKRLESELKIVTEEKEAGKRFKEANAAEVQTLKNRITKLQRRLLGIDEAVDSNEERKIGKRYYKQRQTMMKLLLRKGVTDEVKVKETLTYLENIKNGKDEENERITSES